MEFRSNFISNSASNSSPFYRNRSTHQPSNDFSNLKFPDQVDFSVQGLSSPINHITKPAPFFVDPFLRTSQKISASPVPPHSQYQNSYTNNNAQGLTNIISYTNFVNLPLSNSQNNLSHVRNQSQTVANFPGSGSSSVSVNPCIGVNRQRDDQRARKLTGGERMYRSSVRGHWSSEEDRKLVQLVERYGNKKWSYIAQMMPGRFGKQLRERYSNHLRPGLKKETWSEEEDLKLIEAHEELGNKWANIARMLPGRSESDIKNRWNATKRKCLNAIKKSRNSPKPSSLFENYVKNILTKREPSSTITSESNEIGGSSGADGSVHKQSLPNGSSFDVDDGSVGLPSFSGPSVWTDDDYSMGQFGNMGYMGSLSYGPTFRF